MRFAVAQMSRSMQQEESAISAGPWQVRGLRGVVYLQSSPMCAQLDNNHVMMPRPSDERWLQHEEAHVRVSTHPLH
jgi:hypothetical protein